VEGNEVRKIEEKTLYVAAMVFLLLLFVVMITIDEDSRELLVMEGGSVETLTAVLYFVCFGFIMTQGGLAFLKKHYYLASVSILFGLRELDFDDRFTTGTILSSSFYIREHIPFHEKIIGGIVILLCLAIGFLIVRNHLTDFLSEIKKRSPRSLGVMLTMALIVTSQTLDGLGRKLKPIGLKLTPPIASYSTALEEILELGVPMLLTIMFTCHFRDQAERSGYR
jgi:hypothetical protein